MTRFYHSSSLLRRIYSEKKSLSSFAFVIVILLVFLISSCEEGPTKIGSDLLPSNDFVTLGSVDTLSVWSYTMYESTLPTNDPTAAFIGNVDDEYFGTTRAEFVSEVRLSGRFNYGPVTIDSVRLHLRLLTVKGGSSGTGNILTFSEIADRIYVDSTYYSDTPVNTTGYSIATQIPPLTPDTINNVSIPVPVELAEYILRDTSMLFYSNKIPDFRSYFKGIHFSVSSTVDPVIFTFSLASPAATGSNYNNYFVVYMHDTAYVKRKYYFILDPVHKNAAFNRFSHDFSTADPDKQIEHINDPNYRDTLTYLQYLNGVYTKIVFPGLDTLKEVLSNSKFSINKARIAVPAYYDGDRFTVNTLPAKLRLRYADKDGTKFDVPDYNVDTQNKFFDGTLHKLDSTYYFNIPTYIQSYLEDKTGNFKPELEIFQGQTGLNSAVLRANGNSLPVRFELTYTRF